ncbi:MAG: DUF896 domain-containing protein [Clostridia bacterium]
MKKEKIARLEELTKIKNESQLMGSLLKEYEELKKEYLQSIKDNLKAQIESYGLVKKKE